MGGPKSGILTIGYPISDFEDGSGLKAEGGKTPEEAVAKLWLALNAAPREPLT
jgi:hypothetical protein